jgi:tripartite-type tricarboxylate transporter receptor subunit TctC
MATKKTRSAVAVDSRANGEPRPTALHFARRKYGMVRMTGYAQWMWRCILVALPAIGMSVPAAAQIYPAKTVRFIVAYAPGGGTDATARTIATRLAERWGQSVVVDNRAGGNGMIGADIVAKSAPDGYTVLVSASSEMSMNVALFSKMPYDPVKSFAPVTLVSVSPPLLLVHPSVPVKSTRELIALAKAQPGVLGYASVGIGSPQHFAGELLNLEAKIKMNHIPYKGAGPALIDLVGGHVPVGMIAVVVAIPHIKTNRLRPLAVTTLKRSPSLPDVPAISETIPGFDIGQWFAVWVPAGTPSDVVRKLNADIVAVVQAPDYRAMMREVATEVVGSTPEELRKLQLSEIEKYKRIAVAANIKTD